MQEIRPERVVYAGSVRVICFPPSRHVRIVDRIFAWAFLEYAHIGVEADGVFYDFRRPGKSFIAWRPSMLYEQWRPSVSIDLGGKLCYQYDVPKFNIFSFNCAHAVAYSLGLKPGRTCTPAWVVRKLEGCGYARRRFTL